METKAVFKSQLQYTMYASERRYENREVPDPALEWVWAVPQRISITQRKQLK